VGFDVRVLRCIAPIALKRGTWPVCFDELWQQIAAKVRASEAARQMVDVLMLVRDHGPEHVELAFAARSRPARTTAAPSPSSPAARSARDGGAGGALGSQRSHTRSALTGCT
jgi:hypothetical protein